MSDLDQGLPLGKAALRSGMSPNTARRYRDLEGLPSELKEPRSWRTRLDPFDSDWAGLESMLEAAPELEAKSLFEYLQREHPGVYEPGQLRTLQRRVRRWRSTMGPDKEVFFAQQHVAGEAVQLDFTWATELRVTIGGELFEHMLCVCVLPYSKWLWATTCRSESMLALKDGLQEALFRLGRVPSWIQTDNSTAATHDLPGGKRGFNVAYAEFVSHLGLKPRTIAVGKSEQNGTVEASNGAVKRRLEQHLLLRGNREFETIEAYEVWRSDILDAANAHRGERLTEELAAMKPLAAERVATHTVSRVRVSGWSTIRVKQNSYSVPSRLIGERVDVHVFEDRIEVYLGSAQQLRTERLLGRQGHRVDYRHIIWSLVRKPGAFARYRYRDELFPTLAFRRAYDALSDGLVARDADIAYLRLLHLAASTMESEVEVALDCLLEAHELPMPEAVKELVCPSKAVIPKLDDFEPDLSTYDALLSAVGGGQ